jgi:hypothetical protein
VMVTVTTVSRGSVLPFGTDAPTGANYRP